MTIETQSAGIRLMLVDDHAMVRMGFRLMFETTPDIRVVAEAEDAERAWQLYPQVAPDAVMMDVSMPGASGIAATQRILARDPRARILVVSMHASPGIATQVIKAGALGYLTKAGAPEALIDGVRAVAAGRRYVDPAIAERMRRQPDGHPATLLSPREFEVFLQLARGLTVNRVAERLSLSSSTVGTYLYQVKQKLGVAHQTELALIAMRHGLLESPPGREDALPD